MEEEIGVEEERVRRNRGTKKEKHKADMRTTKNKRDETKEEGE